MRKQTKEIKIGNIHIGGQNKIAIQSMTNTKTSNIAETMAQINELFSIGCDIVRVAVLDEEDCLALKEITSSAPCPIVADIHFDYKLALGAIANGISKLRINPGNISNYEHIKLIVEKCQEKHIPIRIGINSGSIAKDIYDKYGNTAKALFESAKQNIEILENLGFNDIVVSVKSSNVNKVYSAYKMLSENYNYPLHLGVTEAGLEYSGVVKSSVALGALLLEGIGDTIRVSLTTNPIYEVKAAKEILSSLDMYDKPILVSCPTCGRCQYDMFPIANEIDEYLNKFQKKIKVAIMGCVVNGPGEAKDADIGIAGGKNCAVLFKKGIVTKKLPYDKIIPILKAEIYLIANNLSYEIIDNKIIIKQNNNIIDINNYGEEELKNIIKTLIN